MRIGSCCPSCPSPFTALRRAILNLTNFRSAAARTAGGPRLGHETPTELPSGSGPVQLGGASSSSSLSAGGASGGMDQPGSGATSLKNLGRQGKDELKSELRAKFSGGGGGGEGAVNLGYESDTEPSTAPVPKPRRSHSTGSNGSGGAGRGPSPTPSQRSVFLSGADRGETSTETPPSSPPLSKKPTLFRSGGTSGGQEATRSSSPTPSDDSSGSVDIFGWPREDNSQPIKKKGDNSGWSGFAGKNTGLRGIGGEGNDPTVFFSPGKSGGFSGFNMGGESKASAIGGGTTTSHQDRSRSSSTSSSSSSSSSDSSTGHPQETAL